MPLDLLFENAGDYERTHQIMLYVLFKEGRLSEHQGLSPTKGVGWEDEKRFFDITLKAESGLVTGVEVKTWSTVSVDQAQRQRTGPARRSGSSPMCSSGSPISRACRRIRSRARSTSVPRSFA